MIHQITPMGVMARCAQRGSPARVLRRFLPNLAGAVTCPGRFFGDLAMAGPTWGDWAGAAIWSIIVIIATVAFG